MLGVSETGVTWWSGSEVADCYRILSVNPFLKVVFAVDIINVFLSEAVKLLDLSFGFLRTKGSKC